MRIYELSKKINLSSREILTNLAALGIGARSHMSGVDNDVVKKLQDYLSEKKKKTRKKKKDRNKPGKNKPSADAAKEPVEQGASPRNEQTAVHSSTDNAVETIQQMRNFKGHPVKFWPQVLETAVRLAGATTGMVLVEGKTAGTWKQVCSASLHASGTEQSDMLDTIVRQIADASLQNSSGWDSRRINGASGFNLAALGVCLTVDETSRPQVAVFLFDALSAEHVQQTASMLKLIADTPLLYQRGRSAERAEKDVLRFSEALDLMVLINAEKKYMSAAMTFINEVASRYTCTRVSLGWIESGYVRMQAVSHMERFEGKMDIVQSLETAMEEAFDQDEEILIPATGESTAVARDHESFSDVQGVKAMVSLPVRLNDGPAGVLTCERSEAPFSEEEVYGLRILCDQAAQRLDDLKKRDKWVGAKVKVSVSRGASKLIGVEHTFAKCIGLLLCALLLFLVAGSLTHRVEAPFILRSDDVRYLPAPFEGYIDDVYVKVGERVNEGDILLTLDTKDLLLEESAEFASQVRYMREAEKARSANLLADMKIALAQSDQAGARIDLVRHNIQRAEVKAPFSGIVVEGDLEDLKGAAVKKGDVLFKVSRLERLYAELEVSEQDIHELSSLTAGEIAFVSQPRMKFPVTIEKINPVAVAKESEGNVFLVHCTLPESKEWWRPGMSGVAKMSAGKRNALWILTHRTMDFLRMKLWW